MNVPRTFDVMMSIAPSLLKSATENCEPTPDRLTAEPREEIQILIRLVEHQPAAAGTRRDTGQLAVLCLPLRRAERVPAGERGPAEGRVRPEIIRRSLCARPDGGQRRHRHDASDPNAPAHHLLRLLLRAWLAEKCERAQLARCHEVHHAILVQIHGKHFRSDTRAVVN